jgi:hypothetical protein
LYRAIGEGPQIEQLRLDLKEDPEWSSAQHQQHPSSNLFNRTPMSARFFIRGSLLRLFATLSALNLQGTTHLEFHVSVLDDLMRHLEGAVVYMPALANVIVWADLMSHAVQLIRHLAWHVHSTTKSTVFQVRGDGRASATLHFISIPADDPNPLRPQMQLSILEFMIFDSRNSNSMFDFRDSFWNSPVIVEATEILITWERPRNLMTELAHAFQIFTGPFRADVPFPFLQHLDFEIFSENEDKPASVRTVHSERCSSFFHAMADARLRQNAPLASFRMYVDGEKYVHMLRDAHSGLLIQSSLEDGDTDEGESEDGSTDEDYRRTVLEGEEEIDDEKQAKPMPPSENTTTV